MALNDRQQQKGFEKKKPNLSREDRPKPHDLNAEKAVLGAMLIDSPDATNTAIEKLGNSKVFYSDAHQKIYETILELHQKDSGIDTISVSKALSDKGVLDQIGGEAYLMEMQNLIATTANLETWCQMVHDRAVLRRIIDSCSIATEKCFDSEKEVGDILDEVERSVLEARTLGEKQSIHDIKTLIFESAIPYLEKLSKRDETVAGIPTGFADIDDKITGMKPGEMFVIAARPSVGKTSMAMSIVRNVALNPTNPKSILIFTLEMTAEQIARRILCAEAGVSEKSFRDKHINPGIWQRVTGAATSFNNARIFIDPTPALKVMEMRARARRMKSQQKIDLIVIDYLQLMRADVDRKNDNRQQEVSLISAGIKALAKELSVPVLVLAQLNRATEMQKGGPKLSNLRESGSIEQDADIVGFIHRDTEKQKEASEDEKKSGLESEFIIEKNRNGEPGKMLLSFFPLTASFGCRARYKDSDVPRN